MSTGRDNYSRQAKYYCLSDKIGFHSLRHTFGSMLAASGVHPKIAQELMRHSNINLTMGIYTHAQANQIEAAVNNLPDFQREFQINERYTC